MLCTLAFWNVVYFYTFVYIEHAPTDCCESRFFVVVCVCVGIQTKSINRVKKSRMYRICAGGGSVFLYFLPVKWAANQIHSYSYHRFHATLFLKTKHFLFIFWNYSFAERPKTRINKRINGTLLFECKWTPQQLFFFSSSSSGRERFEIFST